MPVFSYIELKMDEIIQIWMSCIILTWMILSKVVSDSHKHSFLSLVHVQGSAYSTNVSYNCSHLPHNALHSPSYQPKISVRL